jgi:hypothetical protein
MPRYLLCHRHLADECGASVSAWRGFESPLRGAAMVTSCQFGRHHAWWQVDAASATEALALLPRFVAQRSDVIRVAELRLP